MPHAPDPADPRAGRGISRRSALRVGGGGALAVVLGGIAGWIDRRDDNTYPTGAPPSTSTPASTTTVPVQLPEIGEIDAAIVALGARVIETTGERDVGALLAQLPAADGDPIVSAAAIVRDDFLASRTIVVDGWVLAASEARAAAVVALLCEDLSC